MESKNSLERNYQDKLNKYITIQDIRQANENKYLTLRKKKRYNELEIPIKNTANFLNEKYYNIHINLLKTNNDDIRNFSIDLKRSEYTMKNLICLLNSKNDDEVKFGIYATRIFFQHIATQIHYYKNLNQQNNINHDGFNHLHNANEEKKIHNYKIKLNEIEKINIDDNIMEIFLEKEIIDYLFQIIKRCQITNEFKDQINIFESLWIFINMSAIPIKQENQKRKFYSYFFNTDNLNALLYMLDYKKYPLEIMYNILFLFKNFINYNPLVKEYLINTHLTSILTEYLKSAYTLNIEITTRIFEILHGLYSENMNIILSDETYQILFKIFSISLISFRNPTLIRYSIEILRMISRNKKPEIINLFDDFNLMKLLNGIIFDSPINNNEIFINLILDIFYNIISNFTDKIKTNYLDTQHLMVFFHNLINKYNEENITPQYEVYENILTSVNNLIFHNQNINVLYILGEGKEILNFILKSIDDVSPNIKYLGLKSICNILYDDINDNQNGIHINKEILYVIIDKIKKTLVFDYLNCGYIIIQCLYFIILKSKKQKLVNEFRNLFLKEGFKDLLVKIKIKLMNDTKEGNLTKEEETNFYNFIAEINDFLDENEI